MLLLETLAERRITEATKRGEFNCLPGEGRPLDLEEDPLVPEDLRLANRILKNAGYTPADLPKEEKSGRNKIALLKLRLENRYFSKVMRKLSR